MANNIIAQMKKGNKTAIAEALSHPGAIYRMNAIACAALSMIKDADVVDKLEELTHDKTIVSGYSVSSFANAALELLGIKVYTKDDATTKELIKSRFEFVR